MPGDPSTDPRVRQAHELFTSARYAEAYAQFEPLTREYPAHWAIRYSAGACLLNLGQTARAITELKLATTLNPNAPLPLLELARALSLTEQYEPARRAIDRALALKPGWEQAVAAKVDLLSLLAEHDQAQALALELLEHGVTDPACAAMLAPSIARAGKPEEAIALLERFAGDEAIPEPTKRSTLYALGDLLDKAQRYDEAWGAFARANALAAQPFDPSAHAVAVDCMITAWTPGAIASLPAPAKPATNLLLIVGMPRSGTSLAEQILASHPDVTPGGERDTLARLSFDLLTAPDPAQSYFLTDPEPLQDQTTLDRAARTLASSIPPKARRASVFTDKMPDNWRHLGLARALAPQARVVWCRRDPRDTCLSCHFQNFFGATAWRTNLANAASVYKDHDRLMRHWQSAVDLPILELVYEDLVSDQEAQTRRLIDFAGLPWDDACLRFHESDHVVRTRSNEQVRRPMYRSAVARWRNYEAHIPALTNAFGAEDTPA